MKTNRSHAVAWPMAMLIAGWMGFGAAWADSTDTAREVLDEFFEATGGEDWLVNDGWMDPEVDVVDRFGVIPGFFSNRRLVLPENNLVGFIPDSITEIGFDSYDHWAGSGLDLCWNYLQMPPKGTELFEFIQSRHAGGDLTGCNNRDRMPLDATFSGSWYQPARSGEGLSQMLVDNGKVLTYWFTHGQTYEEPQNWMLFVEDPGELSVRAGQVFRPRNGRFGSGRVRMGEDGPEVPPLERWFGEMHLDRVGMDRLHFWYTTPRASKFGKQPEKDMPGTGPQLTPPPPPQLSERFDLVALTDLAECLDD